MTKEIVSNTSEGDWGQRLLQMQKSIEILRTELEERLRFSTLLAEISACFINFPTDQINNELDGAQRCICEFLDLDRSAFWKVPDRDRGMRSGSPCLQSHSARSLCSSSPVIFPEKRQSLLRKTARESSLSNP